MKTSTKVVVWILVGIGLVAFFFLAIAITMMLAPGLEIFGVKYVSAKVGKYKYTNDCKTVFSSSSVTLNTGEVPITITFGEVGTTGLTFVQNFQGYTKSADTAGVKITKNDNGTAVIDITEYKKFIWANSMQQFYLTLKFPSTYYGALIINSTNSSVDLKSAAAGTNLSSLTISTGGKIDFNKNKDNQNNKFNIAGDFKITSKSALTLGKNMTFGGNIVANMGNESLTIESPVAKDITFKSGAGSLNFNTCKNLKATTGSGSIKTLKTTGMPNSISGSLNVTTGSGKIEIGSVLGLSNSITTKSGDINLNKVNGSLNINTLKSRITLGEVGSPDITAEGNGYIIITKVTGSLKANIIGLSGNLSCGAIAGGAEVSTKNGAIALNGNIGANLKATTAEGSITAATIGGKAEIKTTRGPINIGTIQSAGSVINSSYGRVTIENIVQDLTVNSSTSAVYNLGTVGTLNFSATNSSVTAGSITSQAKIKTSANVTLGTTGDVNNADVNAGMGNVNLSNTTGTLHVMSTNRTITLNNKSSEDIKINKKLVGSSWVDIANGSAVNATGLRGKVAVCSSFKINLQFAEITGNVDVSAKRSEPVKIDATCTMYNIVNYDLNTQKTACHCTVYHGSELAIANGSGTSHAQNQCSSSNTIRVITDGAPIELKLAG